MMKACRLTAVAAFYHHEKGEGQKTLHREAKWVCSRIVFCGHFAWYNPPQHTTLSISALEI